MSLGTVITATFATALLTASFASFAKDLYKISVTPGTPACHSLRLLPVEDEVTADISTSGVSGYTMSFSVTGEGDEQVKVTNLFESAHGSMSPTLVIRVGELATVSSGETNRPSGGIA